jgi:hypothetical protein
VFLTLLVYERKLHDLPAERSAAKLDLHFGPGGGGRREERKSDPVAEDG